MRKKYLLSLVLTIGLIISSCGSKEIENENSSETKEENVISTEKNDDEMFTNRDLDASYDESQSTIIELNETTAACESESVKVDGGQVTITEEGTYIVRGSLANGQILIEARDTDKVQIVLDGATITSENSAALYIKEADKVFITLADGTENVLSNGGTFEAIDDNNIDGAIFSKQDLTFNGNGSLQVESPAAHGIVCKDDLVFTGGQYEIISSSHGLDANDSFRLTEAAITVAAGKDGIHVENEDNAEKGFVYMENGKLDITAEGDGVSASFAMEMKEGTIKVLAGGGYENGTKSSSDSWGDFGGKGGPGGFGGGQGGQKPGETGTSRSSEVGEVSDTSSEDSTSMKGLKSDGDMTIYGGIITIDSADDGLHSNASMIIHSGTFEIASGDDGIHAEDTLDIKNGQINIAQSYEGLEALHIIVSGGDIDLVASDDGLNAAGGTDSSGMGGREQMGGGMPGGHGGMSGNSDGSIVISGGDIYMNASGDGIDANGTLEIKDGYVVVCGPTRGDTAVLDYDVSATITGGTFIGTGSISMAQVFSDAEQGIYAVQCSCAAGSLITLTDASGNEVISYIPELDFTFVCLSSPDIVSGESYTIAVDGVEGTFEAQ